MKRFLDLRISVALIWVGFFLLNLFVLLCLRRALVSAEGVDAAIADPIDKLIGRYVEYYAAFIATAGTLLAKGALAKQKVQRRVNDVRPVWFWVALSVSVLFNVWVTQIFHGQTIQAAAREFELITGISNIIIGPLVVLFFGAERSA